jgi:hypothetical protein
MSRLSTGWWRGRRGFVSAVRTELSFSAVLQMLNLALVRSDMLHAAKTTLVSVLSASWPVWDCEPAETH